MKENVSNDELVGAHLEQKEMEETENKPGMKEVTSFKVDILTTFIDYRDILI